MFTVALFTIGKIWKQPNVFEGWMNKENMAYNVIFSAIYKKEILTSAKTWMNQEGIMLIEISQTEKDKYLLCVESFFF